MIAEKIWANEAIMQYPKQWIVMVHMETDRTTHKVMGTVHSVVHSWEEAFEIFTNLGEDMGRKTIFEGFDDTPHIGGLY